MYSGYNQMGNQQNVYNHQQQGSYHSSQKQNQQYPNSQPFPQPKYYANAPTHNQPTNNTKMNNNSNGSQYGGGSGGSKSKALIQPPSLNFEEQMDINENSYHQKPPMTISNNLHSEFDGYHHQQDEQNWANEAEIASMFWQQRCMTMLERFEWFYERYQIIRQQYLSLSDQMQKMDSQEEWHHFQQHHNELHEKIEQMEQELTAVLGQNEQLLQQKHTQDNQSVWQQRYQELLGNFKSLQEQMANNQSNNGNGQITQQYRQLQQHYAQLQYQYNEIYNEYQKYRETGVGDLEQQLSSYMQQIQNYKGKLSELHGENVQLQNMLVQLQQQNNHFKQQKFTSGNDRQKYQELLSQVYEKQEQIRSLQQQFKSKSKVSSNISNYQSIIDQKNRQILQLQKLLQKRNLQLKQIKSTNLTTLQQLKIRLKEQNDKQKHSLLRNIKELEKQIEGFRKENSKLSESNYKIQNLQKKLGYSNKQIENLNQSIKKKNQELIQLRSLTYQVDKLKQAQSQFSKIVDEKDRLAELIRKKNQQIEHLLSQNEHLSQLNQEMSNRRQQFNSRNLRVQIQDLNGTIQHLKNQLNRQKILLLSKQDYSIKLQQQLKQTKQKLVMLNQVYEMQSQGWKEREVKISAKTNDYDEKIKNIDYQFNIQLKDTLQREIAVLRKQNIQKQTALRKYDENQLVLLSKISVFQQQQSQFDKEIQLVKQKNKKYEYQLSNMNKKYRQLQQIYKIKQDQVNHIQSRLNQSTNTERKLRRELQQHDNHLRLKNKTIEQLQYHLKVNINKVEQGNKIAAQNSKLHLLIESLQRDHNDKLQMSKIKGLSAINSRSTLIDKPDSNSLVHILTQQNQHLKQEINKILQTYSQIAQNNHQHPKSIPQHLNKRLNQFNNRLQITIKGSSSAINHTQSQKTMHLWQQERASLINHYQSQIKSLKQQLQTKKFDYSQVSNISKQSGVGNTKKIAFNRFGSQTVKEQLQFLRQKNREYQDRNNDLIKVNQQLKQKIQSILQINQSNSTLEYYKQQLQKCQQEYQVLKNKYKKLHEENRQNKLDLTTKNTKLSQELQFKLIELQIVIQEQQRKISLLQSQKLTTDNQRATLIHNMNIHNISGKNKEKDKESHIYKSSGGRSDYYEQSKSNKAIVDVKNIITSPKTSQKESFLHSKFENIHNQFGSILNNAHVSIDDISQSKQVCNNISINNRHKYSKKY